MTEDNYNDMLIHDAFPPLRNKDIPRLAMVADMFIRYWCHTPADELLRTVYTEPGAEYTPSKEHRRRHGTGIASFWGPLTLPQRFRFMKAAYIRYAEPLTYGVYFEEPVEDKVSDHIRELVDDMLSDKQASVVADLEILQAMEDAGHIILHSHTGEEVGHWTGQMVQAWYIEGVPAGKPRTFTFAGQKWRVNYIDGCFNPFVCLEDRHVPSFT